MCFKICVIGCGDMSTLVHGDSFAHYARENKNTLLVACCDLEQTRASAYKEKFGFERSYTDYIKMLDQEKPNAVSIILPPKLTKCMSINVIKKGYPIIIEKPPGLNSDETLEIIKFANEFNVTVRVAFNRRFMPLISKLKAMIKEEQIYDIYYNMIRYNRLDEDFSTTAIHAIDTVKFLSGSNYKYVKFKYQNLTEIGDSVANIYLDCEFESGAFAKINLIVLGGADFERVEVNSRSNTFFLNMPISSSFDCPGQLLHCKDKNIISNISGEDSVPSFISGGFYNENQVFFDMIRNGVSESDIESGLQSVIIADCIRNRKDECFF